MSIHSTEYVRLSADSPSVHSSWHLVTLTFWAAAKLQVFVVNFLKAQNAEKPVPNWTSENEIKVVNGSK